MADDLRELAAEVEIGLDNGHGTGAPITVAEREWLAGQFRADGALRLAMTVEGCGRRYGDACDQCARLRDAQANPDPA